MNRPGVRLSPRMIFAQVFLPVFLLSIVLLSPARLLASMTPGEPLDDGWEFVKGDLGGIWEALRIENSSNLPVWNSVKLPHSYNAFDAVDPDGFYYQGPAWYRKWIDISKPIDNGRIMLHFQGAGQKTEVYVFQTLIGSHVGGYDEFRFDITDAVIEFLACPDFGNMYEGKVPLVIRTDNSRDLEMIPSDLSDFHLYGGLYRHVSLGYLPAVSIDRIHVIPTTTFPYEQALITLNIHLNNPYKSVKEVKLDYEILDPENRIVARGVSKNLAWNGHLEISEIEIANPWLWSTKNPQLYTVNVRLFSESVTHGKTVRFGIRDFEFKKNGPFYLNGERLFIKGTHRHEDHAGLGPAMTGELLLREMELMKAMGVNFIRLGHYQQSRQVLELCDELGILVWEEIPWCRGGLGGETYQEQARRMLTNMIEQHYNHPSVIIWGLGNENDWPGDFDTFEEHKIRAFMKELHDLSHRLDPTRKTGIRRADFLKDVIDVYSPSIWAGWYRGTYRDYKSAALHWIQDTDHFFHMEWGGDSHPGRFSENPELALGHVASGDVDERHGDFRMSGGLPRASRDGDWSESYMVNLFDWHLKEMETMEDLTGAAQWPFKDFSTPLRPENPIPYVNQKGLVQRDLTKKESYYVFQSYWTEAPMVRIYGHTWTTRHGEPSESKEVKVFSNCETAELFVNGESQGIRARNSKDFPAAGLRWMVQYVEGENQLRVVAQKQRTQVQDSLIVHYQTTPWAEAARMRIEQFAANNDTVEVRVIMLDSLGVFCLDARQRISFQLAGDGSLIDNLGTAKGSRTIELANGKASILVKLNQGSSVISVHSEGFNSEFLILEETGISTSQEPERLGPAKLFALPDQETVLSLMTSVADWQLENLPNPVLRPGGNLAWYEHFDWTNAAFYTGVMALWQTTGAQKYFDIMHSFAQEAAWQPGKRLLHADDHAIGQVYAEMALHKNDTTLLQPIRDTFDEIMKTPVSGKELWWWCDALYMAPPTLARLAKATGNKKYLDFMNDMWWSSTEHLYDKDEHLFYRDDRYKIKMDGSGRREINGEKVFWSRGNGWVLAGIARVLQYMPENYPDRHRYETLFTEMAARIVGLQGNDGLWRSSLLNPLGHGESSGSAFYVYALAWGINQGLLSADLYIPYALRGWYGLTNLVHPSGKLGWTQQIGHGPADIHENMSEVYGAGALLLAGSEIIKLTW